MLLQNLPKKIIWEITKTHSVSHHLFIKVTYNDKIHQCVNTADIQNSIAGQSTFFYLRLSWWWAHRFESRGSVESVGHSASSLAQPTLTWQWSLVAVSHMTPRCSRTCARTTSVTLQWSRWLRSWSLKTLHPWTGRLWSKCKSWVQNETLHQQLLSYRSGFPVGS